MYAFAYTGCLSLNKPPLSVRSWQETEGTLKLEDCGEFNERTINKSVGRIKGWYSTLGLGILGNHPILRPEGARGRHTLTPLSSRLLISYGHLLLAEPEDKTEDKAACWYSPVAEKRMEKGRKCGSSEQTEGIQQLHTLFGIYSFLPSNWPYKEKKGNRVVGPALRFWATLLGSLGLESIWCLLMDQNNRLICFPPLTLTPKD